MDCQTKGAGPITNKWWEEDDWEWAEMKGEQEGWGWGNDWGTSNAAVTVCRREGQILGRAGRCCKTADDRLSERRAYRFGGLRLSLMTVSGFRSQVTAVKEFPEYLSANGCLFCNLLSSLSKDCLWDKATHPSQIYISRWVSPKMVISGCHGHSCSSLCYSCSDGSWEPSTHVQIILCKSHDSSSTAGNNGTQQSYIYIHI